MTLAEKIRLLGEYGNEIAFGYNDSGCFWQMCYGNRGTGSMIFCCIHGCLVADTADFEEAIDLFLEEIETRHGKRTLRDKGRDLSKDIIDKEPEF